MTETQPNMFKYVVIARGDDILISYPHEIDDIPEKTSKILKKIDTNSPYSVIEQNNLLFTASTDSNKLIFLCVCDKSVETVHVGKFLTTLKQQWTQNYGAIADSILPGEKDDEFLPKIAEMMNNINDKLRPTLIKTQAENPVVPTPQNENNDVNQPLLNNKDEQPISNPFAQQPNDTFSLVGDEFSEADALETRGLGFYCRRYRMIIMIMIGLILILYFSLSFYCDDFNIFRCFKNSK